MENTVDLSKLTLSDFDSPYELLYNLLQNVKSGSIEITTLKLAEVTEPYLAFMSKIDTIDMDKATDFIVVATTLIEMKSKNLLPVEQEAMQGEIDEGQFLVNKMKEFALFQETSQKLQQKEDYNKMYKMPDKQADKVRIVLKDMALETLLDAFMDILVKFETKKQPEQKKEIVLDRFTVAEKIVQIRETIKTNNHIKFSDLFDVENTRSEIINIFLALLELLKMQVIKVHQNDLFEEIDIISNIKGEEE